MLNIMINKIIYFDVYMYLRLVKYLKIVFIKFFVYVDNVIDCLYMYNFIFLFN